MIFFRNLAILFIFVFLLSACSSSLENKETSVLGDKLELENNFVIESNSMFYDEIVFMEAITKAKDVESQQNIEAIIVPHHLLAADYIADLMKRASGRNIDRVIIIGPNHENIGGQSIVSAYTSWDTELGDLLPDSEFVEKFLKDLNLSADKYVFENEHSIGSQAPFVKYYFPDAMILPIAISSYADQANAEKLSQWLAENYNDTTLLVFSIDFSHYLDKYSADKQDNLTKQLIEAKEIERILQLGDDNVDSPASLATALLFAKKRGLDTNILYNSNAFDFVNVKPLETTSYFAISFTK